jgi:fatty-acid desaturase
MNIETLRSFRIWNMAIFDYVATFIGAFIVHTIMWKNPLNMKNKDNRTPLQYIISLLFIFITFIGIGTIFHRLFSIQSGLSFYLGFNDNPIRVKK